jgi:hypothetical protein
VVLVTSFADVHATSYVVQNINIHEKLLISLDRADCQLSKTIVYVDIQSINTRNDFGRKMRWQEGRRRKKIVQLVQQRMEAAPKEKKQAGSTADGSGCPTSSRSV